MKVFFFKLVKHRFVSAEFHFAEVQKNGSNSLSGREIKADYFCVSVVNLC